MGITTTTMAVCDFCDENAGLTDKGLPPNGWIVEESGKMYCSDYCYRKARIVEFDLSEKPLTLVKMLLENCLQQINQIIEKEKN